MSLASRIQYLGTVSTQTWIYVAAAVFALIGIICIAQKDTATSKKSRTRVFGGICLGVVVLLLAYSIWDTSKEIVAEEKENDAIREYNRQAEEYNRQGGLLGEAARRSLTRKRPIFDF
jgi:hypothetical protein